MSDSDKLQIPETAKDIGIAIGSVLLVFLLTFAYSGIWPPMVVIESGSMEHGNNPLYEEPGFTHLGTIDTGDLVIVKEAKKSDIITYLQGKKTDYKKYGDYGDVIVYYKNGIKEFEGSPVTPVIHRAMFWVDVVDKNNGTYYIPEIDTFYYGEIKLDEILGDATLGAPCKTSQYPDEDEPNPKCLRNSGYITKGDSTGNPHPDQLTHYDIRGNIPKYRVQPVDPDWVVGVARGELPWFGLIKLFVTQPENYENAPSGCKSMLWISIIFILVGPYTVGKILEVRAQRAELARKKKSKR